MTVSHYLQGLGGLPTFDFPERDADVTLPDPAAVAWRLSAPTYCDAGDEQWEPRFERFLAAVDTTRVRALIVGGWDEAYETSSEGIVKALVDARDRLPALEAVFIGDMLSEDCEISWIAQTLLDHSSNLQHSLTQTS
ncbi:hypothetical protein ACIGO8_07915 [Streptomyces sp. NPDC053493]|uniref:hypothetical protein n=1 Tax=Streptomyces sp. NPDC053493 TaxID=3365705 RepID=UPI0037D01D0D